MEHHIIVGSGVYGASTALELAKLGHRVTILDRSADGYCACDAASNDVNKIIRADYSDAHYCELGKRAIHHWRTNKLYKPFYHEVGLLLHSGTDNPAGADYVAAGVARAHEVVDLENLTDKQAINAELSAASTLPPLAHELRSADEVKRCFPTALGTELGAGLTSIGAQDTQGQTAYFNPRAGWAEAGAATRAALSAAVELGVKVVGGAQVVELLRPDGKLVVGVKTADGREFKTENGGQVVLCTGSWSPQLLVDLLPELKEARQPCKSSAQTIILLQLSEAARKTWKSAPVVINIKTGFYVFEPDAEGVLKAAIHGEGYETPVPPPSASTSYPTLISSPDSEIPANKIELMRQELYTLYPSLADESVAKVVGSRVCWYSDSLDENWLIDRMPGVDGLAIATGDSGHGFKFLPIIGSLIAARMGVGAHKLTEHQQKVFSLAHHLELVEKAEARKRGELSDSVEVGDSMRGRL